MANLSPLIQIPQQLQSNKSSFTGIDYKGPVKANILSQGIDALLPGTPMTTTGSNGTFADDRVQQNMLAALPGFGQLDRMLPTSASGQERQKWAVLSFLTGVGVRENTDRTRKGEQYRQMLEEQAEEKYRRVVGS
jgi:hypothetical protein